MSVFGKQKNRTEFSSVFVLEAGLETIQFGGFGKTSKIKQNLNKINVYRGFCLTFGIERN